MSDLEPKSEHLADAEPPGVRARLLSAGRLVWYRYLYPVCFLAASLLRQGTVVGAVYALLAFLVLSIPALRARHTQPGHWRCMHIAVAVAGAVLLVVAAVLLVLCRTQHLSAAIEQLFFGETGCRGALSIIPEVLVAVAGFLGWLFGNATTEQSSEALAEEYLAPANPLVMPRRLALVSVLLPLTAALDFNLFAWVYHLATVGVIFVWAFPGSASQECSSCHLTLKALLRAALLLAALGQVLVATVCRVPALAAHLSPEVIRILGLEASVWSSAQQLAAFFFAELLLWPCAQVPQTALLGKPLQGSLEETPEARDPQRMEEAPSPLSSPDALPQDVSEAPRGLMKPTVTVRISISAAVADAVRLGCSKSTAGNCSSWLASKALWASRCPVLPFFSLIALPTAWPSMATLPLLLGGLGLLHVPLWHVPPCLLHGTLFYEILLSLVWYSHNIYCNAAAEPLSQVPLAFTWPERLGLQCYLRAGILPDRLRRYIWVVGQVLVIFCMATAARSRAQQAKKARETPSGEVKWIVAEAGRQVLTLSRLVAVAAVLLLPMFMQPASLFGLVYLVWLVCLLVCGAFISYDTSGWDLLRANSAVWHGLVFISNGIILATFVWQVLESRDQDLVGLWRSSWSVAEVLWLHLGVGILAALQAQALSAGVSTQMMLLKSDSALAGFVRISGIFLEMAFMLVMIMLKPFSVDSAFFLLIFIGIVFVEQFNPSSRWRIWLLTIAAAAAAILLPLRYAILMPTVQEWLASPSFPVSKTEHAMLWQALALDDTSFQVRMKLMWLGASMIFAAALRRLHKFSAQLQAPLMSPRMQRLKEHPVLVGIFLKASEASTSMLMFISYFIMQNRNASSLLQIFMLLCLLVSGQWAYAGALISATASALLLAQYAYSFQLFPLTDEQAEYWGLQPSYSTEVSLLLLGIMQHSVKRAAGHLSSTSSPRRSAKDKQASAVWRRIVKEIAAYGAQIGAGLLLLTALFCSNAWSVVHIIVAFTFRMSKDGHRRLEPSAANNWLRLIVLVLVLSLVTGDLSTEVWLPPGWWPKPTDDEIAKWPFCRVFEGSPASLADGTACSLRDDEDGCATQQLRCGRTWQSWLGLVAPHQGGGCSTLTFLALFAACVLRHECLLEMSREEPSEEAREEDASPKRLPYQIYRCGAVLLLICLALAAMWQPSTSLISLGYMLLFFWHLSVMESVLSLDVPFLRKLRDAGETVSFASKQHEQRLRVIKCVRVFNLVVCVLTVASQIPSMPCAFAMPMKAHCPSASLEDDSASFHADDIVCPETFMLSPGQCMQRQRTVGSMLENDGNFFSILLQCVGVHKVLEGLSFNWTSFGHLLVFCAVQIQALTCHRWPEEHTADIEDQVQRILLREKRFQDFLKEWRRLELDRIDTKHKVLLEKLQYLSRYIMTLREIWAHKRGKLSHEEQKTRDQTTRLQELGQSSGFRREDVAEHLQALSEDAADHAGLVAGRLHFAGNFDRDGKWQPESHDGDAKERDPLDLLYEVNPKAASRVEAELNAARETVDWAVLEHLEDLQSEKLLRITKEEVEEKKQVLRMRCREAGQACLAAAPQQARSAVKEGEEEAEEDASETVSDIALHPSPGALQRTFSRALSQQGSGCTGLVHKVFDLALAQIKTHVGFLVDDFLFVVEKDLTLQSHRRDDGLAKLLYKAFWSQSHALLLICVFVRFAIHMSVLASVTVCCVTFSLMTFPYAHPRFWKVLLAWNFAVVIMKVLYQLPFVPTSLDLRHVQEQTEHGLSLGGNLPWEAVLGLLKVVPMMTDESQVTGALVNAMREREVVQSSLFDELWPDMLVLFMLACHWSKLFHSGRTDDPLDICIRLQNADKADKVDTSLVPEERAPTPSPVTASHSSQSQPTESSEESPQGCMGCVRRVFAWRKFWRRALGAAGLRKPAFDLYTPRFVLMMCCFVIILVGWDSLTDGTQSFAHSLTTNSFSSWQVLAVVFTLGLLIEGRVQYSWYTQQRWKATGTEEPGAPLSTKEVARVVSLREERDADLSSAPRSTAMRGSSSSSRKEVVYILYFYQRIVLLAELILLHLFYIMQWSNNPKRKPRMTNAAQVLFYLLFLAYLALSFLQLRFDIHITRGGLGLTHSMSLPNSLVFKAYMAVPFVEEMRVLTDWTVTRTSLDFFMWMKLEDAQQGLYRTTRDMLLRRWYPLFTPRPTWEKALQGGLFLFGLFILIVTPLVLFSNLNPGLLSNRVTSATITGSIFVQTQSEGIRQLQLFEGTQASIRNDTGRLAPDEPADVFEVEFTSKSETVFDVAKGLQDHMIRMLSMPGATAWFQVQYSFLFNGDETLNQAASGPATTSQ
eukprot:TRINITY_DN32872_c0_g1_i1.p1 TRINITY_DN32872_c0_g1~~TRINITY_DN32872_c0_g1_i1.p1  ORF type:complete len:2333 (+),score=468.33 TRINITY_DN32872_c0_g1_i1:25-6999(+)